MEFKASSKYEKQEETDENSGLSFEELSRVLYTLYSTLKDLTKKMG